MPTYSAGASLGEQIILGTSEATLSIIIVPATYTFDAGHDLDDIPAYGDHEPVDLEVDSRGENDGVFYLLCANVSTPIDIGEEDQGDIGGILFFSGTTPIHYEPGTDEYAQLKLIEWRAAEDGGTLSLVQGGARSYGWLRSTEGAEEVSVNSSGHVILTNSRGVIDLSEQGSFAIGSPEGWFPSGHFGLTLVSSVFHEDAMSLWFHGSDAAVETALVEFEEAPKVEIECR